MEAPTVLHVHIKVKFLVSSLSVNMQLLAKLQLNAWSETKYTFPDYSCKSRIKLRWWSTLCRFSPIICFEHFHEMSKCEILLQKYQQ